MGAIFLGLLYISSFWAFALNIVIVLLLIFGTKEMYDAIGKAGYKPIAVPLIFVMISAYPVMHFYSISGLILSLLIAFLIAFIWYIFDEKCSFSDFMTTIFLAYYPTLLFVAILYLNIQYGILPVLIAVGASIFCDVFAYFFGSLIKGPKIFPKISPKKTYAGSFSGLLGGAVGGLIMYLIFEVAKFPTNVIFSFANNYANPILIYLVLGFICAVFAEIGDLGASRIKREVGIKDYSSALGSHGGIMDRLDSILFAMIFMTAYMVLLH